MLRFVFNLTCFAHSFTGTLQQHQQQQQHQKNNNSSNDKNTTTTTTSVRSVSRARYSQAVTLLLSLSLSQVISSAERCVENILSFKILSSCFSPKILSSCSSLLASNCEVRSMMVIEVMVAVAVAAEAVVESPQ